VFDHLQGGMGDDEQTTISSRSMMNLVMREIADSVPLTEETMHLIDLATPPNRLFPSRCTCRANLLVGTAITVLRLSATIDWQAVWIAR
jgi:hypothetical protein